MNPWEKYADQPAQSSDGPWAKYAPPESPQKGGEEGLGSKVAGIAKEAYGAGLEPIAAMATGAVAKPMSELVGMGSIPFHAAGISKTDPKQLQEKLQQMLTYQPKTQAGQAISQYNPLALLGKAFGAGGDKAQETVAPPKTSGPLQSALGSGIGEFVKQLPTFLGAKGGPAAAEAIGGGLKSGAREMMQSALKPSEKAQKTGKASAAIDTLLDTGTNVTKGGVQKLQDRVNVLNDRIADVIKNSPAQIDKVAVTKDMQGLVDKFVKQVKPLDDVRAIQKAWDEFLEHPLLTGDKIPVQLAQEMKQGTTRSLGDKAYGELKTADKEAQKTLARGLKDEIARVAPEVRPLNAEDSKLLNALSLTEKRVLMSANKNPAGLGWLSPNPAKMAAYLADRSELFKSLIARMLNTGSKAMGPVGAAAPALGGIVANQPPTGSPVQQ